MLNQLALQALCQTSLYLLATSYLIDQVCQALGLAFIVGACALLGFHCLKALAIITFVLQCVSVGLFASSRDIQAELLVLFVLGVVLDIGCILTLYTSPKGYEEQIDEVIDDPTNIRQHQTVDEVTP